MCEARAPEDMSRPLARRRRLWQVDPRYHCSIIGTCLSLGDLAAIARKAGLRTPAGASDYRVHASFVQAAAGTGGDAILARLLHKALDRRHKAGIRRFERARTEAEVARKWRCRLDAGEIPGPYWAVMTHPASGEALLSQAFGEVHMLSHMVGATKRAALRRLDRQQAENAALAEALAAEKARAAELRAARDRVLAERDRALADLAAAHLRLEAAGARIDALEDGQEHRALRLQTFRLNGEFMREREKRRKLDQALAGRERKIAELAAENRSLKARAARAQSEKAALRRESLALEAQLAATLRAADEVGDLASCPPVGAGLDLDGRRILYVGGRSRQAVQLRCLVERCNGCFLRHDGGLEQSTRCLMSALARADAVVFPADCISHEASARVRRACRRCRKPLAVLRTSGLASFTLGLSELAEALDGST